MMFTQSYVNSMCESINAMKLTPRQKDHARAVMRAAIEYANAQHGMHASKEAKTVALSPPEVGSIQAAIDADNGGQP